MLYVAPLTVQFLGYRSVSALTRNVLGFYSEISDFAPGFALCLSWTRNKNNLNKTMLNGDTLRTLISVYNLCIHI